MTLIPRTPTVQLSEADLQLKIEAHLDGLGPDFEPDEAERWEMFVQAKIDKHRSTL